ncbi:HNH endonuclease [Archangium sp. Cb G35]|uniref:HNH endonuclease n=1 Tax=Archangium sp. Cb G35 TaxID=1920190 RepID=UPI000B2963C3|nr:HNH endonuclease [Archangium sp. Cb G35]
MSAQAAGRRFGPVLLAVASLVLLGGCVTGYPRGSPASGFGETAGGAGGFPGRHANTAGVAPALLSCAGVALPPDWPDLSAGDEELLVPLLGCSPAEFVQVQQQVDMPRLVEALEDWGAVRLGALGPVRDDAAPALQRKRAAFLLTVTELYGPAYAEVFALFVLHSAHDDEVREVLRLLARDKQLGQTLGLMPAVREELESRGLPLSDHPDRAEQASDVLRGLGRAARDALSTSQTIDGLRYMTLTAQRGQLPPPYQQALREVERALMERHFSPGHVVLGCFDSLTFGVPLGFYSLVVGTGHGAYALSQGQYEQAARELAPATLLVALYTGGKGMRVLSGARAESRMLALQEMAAWWETKLGVEGLRALARDIRASREAGHFVTVGGVDAALALREARGDVARAQAWLSQARSQRAGPTATRAQGSSHLRGRHAQAAGSRRVE